MWNLLLRWSQAASALWAISGGIHSSGGCGVGTPCAVAGQLLLSCVWVMASPQRVTGSGLSSCGWGWPLCMVTGWSLIIWSRAAATHHVSWVAAAPHVVMGSSCSLSGREWWLLLVRLWGSSSSGGHRVGATWVGGAGHCSLCSHGQQLLTWLLEWSLCLGLLRKARLFTHAITAPGVVV